MVGVFFFFIRTTNGEKLQYLRVYMIVLNRALLFFGQRGFRCPVLIKIAGT